MVIRQIEEDRISISDRLISETRVYRREDNLQSGVEFEHLPAS